MPSLTGEANLARIRTIQAIVACSALALALTALVGNALHIDLLRNFTPWGTQIKTNPALCLAFLSVALLLLSRPQKKHGRVVICFASSVVAAISLLTLSEWLFNWDAGIDQLIFPEAVLAKDSSILGRMPINAAGTFLLLSTALLSGLVLKDKRISQVLSYVAFAISLVSVAGITFSVATLAKFGFTTLIAFPMAVSHLFVASAAFVLYPEEGFARIFTSETLGGVLARRLLPAVLLFPALGLITILSNVPGSSDVGLILLVTLNCLALPIAIWLVAETVDRVDAQRMQARESTLQLQQLNVQIKDLYEHAPCGYHCLDENGVILSMNQTELDWLGYTSEELTRSKFTDLLMPESRQLFEITMSRLKSTGTNHDIELMLHAKDGNAIVVLHSSSVTKDPASRHPMVRSIIFDITEKKRAQEEIERLAAIVASSEDAIIGKTLDGTITSWNAAAERIYGYSHDEIVGKNVRLLFPPGTIHDELVDVARRLTAGELIQHYHSVRLRKDGTPVDVSMTISPIRAADGTIIGASTIARDITGQRESQERFRALLESVPDSIIISDESGTISVINKQAELTFGYRREELLGQKIEILLPSELRVQHAAHRASYFADPNLRVMGPGRDLTAVRKDGSLFPVEIALSPLKVAGRMMVISSVRDGTERKRIENELTSLAAALQEHGNQLENLNRELQIARDHALDASRLKSLFLANMSHEIRTPMNGVLGMAELLIRTGLNETQLRYATTIKESGAALLQVINDVLDISKIEVGKLELQLEDFDPVKLVEGAAELLAPQALKKQLVISAYIDPEIPSSLYGDHGRLRQILINLIGNAIKFSAQGAITVRASVEEHDSQSVKVKFSVADRGMGMSEEQVSRLFQPFVQIDPSMTRSYESSGLGLSISKKIVDLMHGEMGVQSEVGQGSTFWFSVPLNYGTKAGIIRRVSIDLHNARVLVVDDEDTTRDIIHDYVVSWGMRNGAARNAKEALELLRAAAKTDPYSVAIIDLMMPETDGLELAKLIREDEELRNTRLILVTAFDKSGISDVALSQGFQGYLTKPIRQSQLFDCLGTVLHEPAAAWFQNTRARTAVNESGPVAKRDELLLVVEDHPINQEVALLLLNDLGFHAHIAKNGFEALELIHQHPYAAVFMDCQMPQLNGLEATRRVREEEEATGKHLCIIAMTAHAIEGSREQCHAAGMDDFISKPIDPQKLETLLNKWLPLETARHSGACTAQIHNGLPIDLDLLEERFGKEKSQRLCRMFLEDAAKELQTIRLSLEKRNRRKLIQSAHGLRGDCAAVCAAEMASLCEQLEVAAKTKHWTRTDEIAKALERSYISVEQFLNITATK